MSDPKPLSEGFTDFKIQTSVHSASVESKEEVIERFTKARDMSKITVTPAAPEVNPFDTNVRKRVAVYCRVSTDNISQTPSFLTQQNYYLNYVRQNSDLHMVAMYKDEGVSATAIKKRTGLIKLIRDAEAGKFDMVIVKDLSRLSRNLMDCMQIIYKFRQLPKPVGILFETEKMYTLDASRDFTLQVLALVAQEESRKKSYSVTSAQRQRYKQGMFMIFDLLGYDRVGVNEIRINPEEALTVQLIFTMYMAGCNPETIASVLNMLGRRKHSHKYKDGGIKEGLVNWNKNSVMNVLKNEKRCGHVDAQKTITPNFLTHKAVKNDTEKADRYYAVGQHDAIVAPNDYFLVQRMMRANRGGWKYGLQEMKIYDKGCLAGGVLTVPNWYGFDSEDYNRACLSACGVDEAELSDIENRIAEEHNKAKIKLSSTEPTQEFPDVIEIDSDDYEKYPKQELKPETKKQDDNFLESFARHIKSLRSEAVTADTRLEVCRAELFSLTEKVCVTFDHLGTSFNKFSFNRLNEGEADTITNVEMIYNPLEQVVVIRKAKEATPSTVNWAVKKNSRYDMKRCCTKGLSSSIYENMNWNKKYKYRIVGRAFEYNGETMLIFFLDSFTEVVPARVYEAKEKTSPKKHERKFLDGILSDDIILPYVEDIEFTKDKDIIELNNTAIYFDSRTLKDERELTLEDLGSEKYSADRISHMLQKGLNPAEGWSYLRGMAVINKAGFTIYPESWADSFGDKIFNGRDEKLQGFLQRAGPMNKGRPYGWTVGVKLPTMEMVNEKIEQLKRMSA